MITHALRSMPNHLSTYSVKCPCSRARSYAANVERLYRSAAIYFDRGARTFLMRSPHRMCSLTATLTVHVACSGLVMCELCVVFTTVNTRFMVVNTLHASCKVCIHCHLCLLVSILDAVREAS